MRPDTKKNLLIAASYAGVLFLGLILGQRTAEENMGKGVSILPLGITDNTGKLQRFIQIINDRYVDFLGVDTLQDKAIAEVLAKLDPHSTYMPPRIARAIGEDLEGSFDGIGVEYYRLRDTLMITAISAGGPAEKAGVRIGDKLIGIDELPIAGVNMNEREVSAKVRGRRGSTVNLWIHRRGRDLPEPLKVVRDKIVVSSIEAAYIIDTTIAYIKVKRFGAETVNDFKNNLRRMRQYGVDKLILDLRENSGGYLRAATDLASEFFEDRKLLVYTQGAHEPRVDYFSNTNGIFRTGKLAVVIDEKSASASEIVAGAVQDLDRGLIIGRRSFGKGLVQEQFDFDDGSAINLTIARYYTPSGRSIQRSYKDGKDRYFNEVLTRYKVDEIEQQNDLALVDSSFFRGLVYKTVSGREVYGGGGIMPDIFVPIDTLGASSFYQRVLQHDLINRFVYTYLVDTVPDYSIDHYQDSYELPESTYEQFTAYAKEQGVESEPRQVSDSRKLIEANMKAIIGRFFFGSEAYFKIKNETDRVLARTVEALERN